MVVIFLPKKVYFKGMKAATLVEHCISMMPLPTSTNAHSRKTRVLTAARVSELMLA